MTKTAFSLLLALICSIILACGGGGNTTPDGEGAALPPVEPSPLAVIDPARRIEWEGHAGVPGGISQRETICATIDAAAYGNGTTDASAAIQSAIESCPENQVVYLPAGTYLLRCPVSFGFASRVTLRSR